MAKLTPAPRRGFASRSGDTHVIGKDGKLRNVDQEAREEKDRPKKAAAGKKSAKKGGAKPRSRSAPAPTPTPAPPPAPPAGE